MSEAGQGDGQTPAAAAAADPATVAAEAATTGPAATAPPGWRLLAGLLVGLGALGTLQVTWLLAAGVLPREFPTDVPARTLGVLAIMLAVAGVGTCILMVTDVDANCRMRGVQLLVGAVLGGAAGVILSALAAPIVGHVMTCATGGSDFSRRISFEWFVHHMHEFSGPWVGWVAGVVALSLGPPHTRADPSARTLLLGVGLVGGVLSSWTVASWSVVCGLWGWGGLFSSPFPGAVLLTGIGFGIVLVGGVRMTSGLHRRAAPPWRELRFALAGLTGAAAASLAALAHVANATPGPIHTFRMLGDSIPFGGSAGALGGAIWASPDLVIIPPLALVVCGAWLIVRRGGQTSEAR